MYQKCVDRFSSRFNDLNSTYSYKSSSNVDSGPNWIIRGVFGLLVMFFIATLIVSVPDSYKHKNRKRKTLFRILILFSIFGLLIYVGPLIVDYFFYGGSFLWWAAIAVLIFSALVSLHSVFYNNDSNLSASDIEMALSETEEYFYKYLKKDALIALAKYFNAPIKSGDTKKSIRSQIYKTLAERMNGNVYGDLEANDSDCWENFFGELFDLEKVHKDLVKKKKESDFLKKLKEMKKN
jgi:hypothetical protein